MKNIKKSSYLNIVNCNTKKESVAPSFHKKNDSSFVWIDIIGKFARLSDNYKDLTIDQDGINEIIELSNSFVAMINQKNLFKTSVIMNFIEINDSHESKKDLSIGCYFPNKNIIEIFVPIINGKLNVRSIVEILSHEVAGHLIYDNFMHIEKKIKRNDPSIFTKLFDNEVCKLHNSNHTVKKALRSFLFSYLNDTNNACNFSNNSKQLFNSEIFSYGISDYVLSYYDKLSGSLKSKAVFDERLMSKNIYEIILSGKFARQFKNINFNKFNIENKFMPTRYILTARGVSNEKIMNAEKMESKGVSLDEIWYESGLVRDCEGNWLKELPTGVYRFNNSVWNKGEKELFDILHNPSLFKIFPELKNIKIKEMPFFSIFTSGAFGIVDGHPTIFIESPKRANLKNIRSYHNERIKEMECLADREQSTLDYFRTLIESGYAHVNVKDLGIKYYGNEKTVQDAYRITSCGRDHLGFHKNYALSGYLSMTYEDVIKKMKSNQNNFKSIIEHELQHAVDWIEGRSCGANLSVITTVETKEIWNVALEFTGIKKHQSEFLEFKKILDNYFDGKFGERCIDLNTNDLRHNELTDQLKKIFPNEKLRRSIADNAAIFAYRNQLGEVRARAVESRANMVMGSLVTTRFGGRVGKTGKITTLPKFEKVDKRVPQIDDVGR